MRTMRFSTAVEKLIREGGCIYHEDWVTDSCVVYDVESDTLRWLSSDEEMRGLLASQYLGGWTWEPFPEAV